MRLPMGVEKSQRPMAFPGLASKYLHVVDDAARSFDFYMKGDPTMLGRIQASSFGAGALLLLCLSLALTSCASVPSEDIRAGSAASAANFSAQDASVLRLARAARAAGDLSGAVNLYRSIASTRTDPAVLVEFGDTLEEMWLFDDAIATFGRVEQKSPARPSALMGLVRVYLNLGQPTIARDFADQALALAPNDPSVLIDRGVVLDALGEHDQAQQSYRHALKGGANSVAARNNLALSLALSAKFDEAIEIIAPIALSASATSQARQNLALIYGLKGDHERAAQISRIDLDENATKANLRLFDLAGGAKR